MLAALSANLLLAHALEVSNPFRSLRTASHQARRYALLTTPPYHTLTKIDFRTSGSQLEELDLDKLELYATEPQPSDEPLIPLVSEL